MATDRLHPEIGVVADWTQTAVVLEDLRKRRTRGNAVARIDRSNPTNHQTRRRKITQAIGSKAVGQRYVAAAQAGDEHAIRDLFAPDATWTSGGELPISVVWKGRAAIIDEFLATAMSHYEPGSISLEITGMIAEHDQVVLQWTSRARTRDGRPYENGCIGVFIIREGKIQDVREYMDALYAHHVAFSDDISPRAAVRGGV